MGKHSKDRQAASPKGYKGEHRPGGSRDQENQTNKTGFRPGDSDRFHRLNQGEGEWFTER